MDERSELRRRLQRLQPRRPEAPARPPLPPGQGLPPGEVLDTGAGPAFRIERLYPSDTPHGSARLADVLGFAGDLAAEVAGRSELGAVSPQDLIFLDTETTGLAGGAGTLVFLVGVGRFEPEGFRLRQYFLRDPAEEPGMLSALLDDLAPAGGFVTFNGQAFDLPLLEMRVQIGLRRRWSAAGRLHLDLLHPARRLWRKALPDCTLGTLERRLLRVERAEADVPGALIPALYLDYLRTGETGGMARVLYHNAVDVLSLVSLATQVLGTYRAQTFEGLSGSEALAVARWHQTAGRAEPAEAAFRQALNEPEAALRAEALARYAAHLKRTDRPAQALEVWEAWHRLDPADPRPCLERAIYEEWRRGDPGAARLWAERALVCLSHWPPGWRRERAWSEVEHRLRRLARKGA